MGGMAHRGTLWRDRCRQQAEEDKLFRNLRSRPRWRWAVRCTKVSASRHAVLTTQHPGNYVTEVGVEDCGTIDDSDRVSSEIPFWSFANASHWSPTRTPFRWRGGASPFDRALATGSRQGRASSEPDTGKNGVWVRTPSCAGWQCLGPELLWIRRWSPEPRAPEATEAPCSADTPPVP
jgi:hypothetical protein